MRGLQYNLSDQMKIQNQMKTLNLAVSRGYSEEDLQLVLITDSVDEAMEHIHKYITSNYKIRPRKRLWWLLEKR